MAIKHLLFPILLLFNFSFAFGQQHINEEEFRYFFSPGKEKNKVIYAGKSHHFTLDVSGKNIKPAKAENPGLATNQHFITADNKILQTSIVPVPQPLPPAFKLGRLTVEQQKQILDGYVNYELDYFSNDLALVLTGVKKEWKTLNGKQFILWHFETPPQPGNSDPAIGQVYLSTICFNQVLVINIPVSQNGASFEMALPYASQVAASLKLYDQKFNSLK